MSFSAVRFGQAEDKTDFPFSLAFGSPLPTSRSPFGENVSGSCRYLTPAKLIACSDEITSMALPRNPMKNHGSLVHWWRPFLGMIPPGFV